MPVFLQVDFHNCLQLFQSIFVVSVGFTFAKTCEEFVGANCKFSLLLMMTSSLVLHVHHL